MADRNKKHTKQRKGFGEKGSGEKLGAFDDDRTIFVGRLSKAITQGELRALFSGCGTITKLNMPVHKESGRLKGVAWIEFQRPENLKKALDLDGRTFMGSEIKVKRSTEGGKGGKGGSSKKLGKADNDCTVYVGNLSFATNENTLSTQFGKFGKVVRVNIPLWHDSQRKRGFALIEFAAKKSAVSAIEKMNSRVIDGRQIIVRSYAQSAKPAPKDKKDKKAKKAPENAKAAPSKVKSLAKEEEDDDENEEEEESEDDEDDEGKEKEEESMAVEDGDGDVDVEEDDDDDE